MLAALVAASSAHASSFAVAVRDVATPVLSGNSVLWITAGSDGSTVVKRVAPDQAPENIATFPAVKHGPGILTLLASPQAMALKQYVQYCAVGCGAGADVVADAVFAAPLGGAVQCLGGFTPHERCEDYTGLPSLSGTLVALGRSEGTAIYDLSNGDRAPLAVVPLTGAQISGDMVAGRPLDGAQDALEVRDWRTGQTVLRLDGGVNGLLSVSDDGTVVFRGPPDQLLSYDVEWASPREPQEHPITPVRREWAVQARGDEVAVATTRFRGSVGVAQLSVYGLDGQRLAADTEPALRLPDPVRHESAWDFNGQQLAWVSEPCTTRTLVVTDVAAPVPPHPEGRCPAAAFVGPVAWTGSRLLVTLRCPPTGTLGCAGRMVLVAHRGHGIRRNNSYVLAQRQPGLEPGARRILRFRISRRAARWLRRHRATSVRATYVGRTPAGFTAPPLVNHAELRLVRR